ncbi:hypothetical protein J6590_087434 [Homalodisca vitripennis]|nr:hypothetical protein J6590_087434 [Homalodisca vitripennis]
MALYIRGYKEGEERKSLGYFDCTKFTSYASFYDVKDFNKIEVRFEVDDESEAYDTDDEEEDNPIKQALNSKECLILPGEVRAKKPSLTLNLGTNGLKVTSEPPPMAGQTGRLQGQDRSEVTCPSSSHARRCLIWLSCDNRRTHYAAPLV